MPLCLIKISWISSQLDFGIFFSRILAKIKKYKLYFFTGILLTTIVIAFLVLCNVNKNIIVKKIYVENIYISGLNKQSARELLEYQLAMRYKDNTMKLNFDEVLWTIKLNDIAFKLEIESTVENAFEIDKQGNFFNKLKLYCGFKKERIYLQTEFSYDQDSLIRILEDIKRQIDQEEKNATVNYKNGNITLNNEVIGRILNIDSSVEKIENCINDRTFLNINLVVDEVEPEITYNDIKEINSVLSNFSTSFNVNDQKRTNNIKIACDKINYTVLKSGYVFSTDIAIGKRIAENGYMDAPIIMNNELTQGLGGGVCQVSTTLYNSVLKAKLDVLERTHHSMPIAYTEAGLDATLAENLFDLKFSNNKESAICLVAEVVGNSIRFSILGKKEQSQTNVVLKSEVIGEYMPVGEVIIYENSIPKGEILTIRESRKGIRVIVYRETYDKSGKLIEREQISVDYYPPVKAIIKMNPIHKDKK